MKLRTQLLACVVASAAFSIGALLAVLNAANEQLRAAQAQASAQGATHQVLGLLALTQEYARHAEDRAAQQWHDRHRQVLSLLPPSGVDGTAIEGVDELRDVARDLPALFARLQDIGDRTDSFSVRRRELLLDQLLASSQAMSDHAAQWYAHATVSRASAEQRFLRLAIGAPLLLLVLMTALALLVYRRMLLPLKGLHDATAAVASGNMEARVGLTRNDEIGEVARRFDEMTQQLALRRDQLRRSEKQMRAVADNMPALIAYIDREGLWHYANARYRTVYGVDPQELLGRTVAENLGPEVAREVKPYKEAALAGQRQSFERHAQEHGLDHYFLTEYVPDVEPDGSVIGYYVMVGDITARKKAEMAQALSEERVRSILDHAPDAFVSVNSQGRLTEWNHQAEAVFGWRRDEVLGRPLAEVLIPAEQRAAHLSAFAQFTVSGQGSEVNQRVELQALHKNGSQIPVELSVAALRENQQWTANAFLRDISQRKHAEQALRASEQRLRAIADNLPVLISYVDMDERLQFANATYRDWWGLDPQAMLGQLVADVLGAEIYGARKAYLQRALQGERVEFDNEATGLGVVRSMRTCYVPDRDAEGRMCGVYGLSNDITAMKQAQQQLQALARNDPLTGLANRLQFDEKLAEVLLRSERSGSGVALLFLDVDHFKSVNDTLGHAGGDAVLKEVARRLVASVRASDTVVRLGGDEFVVILEGLHHAGELELVGRKIVGAFAEPMLLHGRSLRVSTSVGGGYHAASEGRIAPADLLARADAALYAAKKAGRNTFRMKPAQPQQVLDSVTDHR